MAVRVSPSCQRAGWDDDSGVNGLRSRLGRAVIVTRAGPCHPLLGLGLGRRPAIGRSHRPPIERLSRPPRRR